MLVLWMSVGVAVWPAQSQAFDAPIFVRAWGNEGPPNGLSQPNGITADVSGNLFVADSGNQRIQKYDSTGAFLLRWGGVGSGPGQFNYPSDVAVGISGDVYVANENDGRVDAFNSAGAFLLSIGHSGPLGGPGGTFYLGPPGVACGPNGHVYASDDGNARIQEFDASGSFVRTWGSAGNGDGRFGLIGPLAVAPDGTVFAADQSNNYIQAFSSTGVFLSRWGSSGSGPGQFKHVEGLGPDASGNLYVADTDNDRIQVFSSAGTYLGQWGSHGSGNSQFISPSDVVVVGSAIYVLDAGNNRVVEFTSTPVAATPTSWGKVKSIYH